MTTLSRCPPFIAVTKSVPDLFKSAMDSISCNAWGTYSLYLQIYGTYMDTDDRWRCSQYRYELVPLYRRRRHLRRRL